MKGNRRKREHSKVVRINVSLTPLLLNECEQIVNSRGFTGVSDYFQAAIRRDSPNPNIQLK